MATDRTEAAKRGHHRKRSSQHPFLMLEHRIVDSPAFTSLKPSAQVLLVLMARQFNGANNGHIGATHTFCKKYGIGSDHTLKDAIGQLIARGLIYRTRSHGANGQWAKYALTWIPISKDTSGLFLAGFIANGWRDWQPTEKKTSPQKVRVGTRKKCGFSDESPAETASQPTVKTASIEDSAIYGAWVSGYLARLAKHGPAFMTACSVALREVCHAA